MYNRDVLMYVKCVANVFGNNDLYEIQTCHGAQHHIHVVDDDFQVSNQKHEVQPCSSGSRPGDSRASAAAMLKASPALPTSPSELFGQRLATTAGVLSALLPGEW